MDLADSDAQVSLAQHFAEQRIRNGKANESDAKEYIEGTLLPYFRAYRTLLTWELRSKSGMWLALPAEVQASLVVLLRWVPGRPVHASAKQPELHASLSSVCTTFLQLKQHNPCNS